MLDQQRGRAAVEHVEGRAGARIDLQEPPRVAIDEAVGAGKADEAGRPRQAQSRLRDRRGERRRDRPRLVAAAGERPGIAERPQRRGRLPLFGEHQGLDGVSIGQKIQGDGAAGPARLEIVAGGRGPGGTRADMRAAAAAGPLEQPSAGLGHRAGTDRRVRDREAFAERGEAERVLEEGDGLRARTEQAVAGGDLGDEIRRALEPAAEDDAEGPARPRRQVVEPRQHAGSVAVARAEAAGQRPVMRGEHQGVLVAEQVEHERAQARPPGCLRQRPAGLGGDQDRAALTGTREAQGRAQPAISTASW